MSRRRMGASPEGAPAVESSAAWPAAPCAAGPTGWHDGAAGDRAAGGRLVAGLPRVNCWTIA